MKKTLVFLAALVALTGTVRVALLSAAPTIDATGATPAYVVVNTPTSVLVTAQIPGPTVVVGNGVSLQRLDRFGKVIGTLGLMNDAGRNGDARPGDRIFTLKITVNEPVLGEIRFQVSAAFLGVLSRIVSLPIVVTIDPFVLPPDPGLAGKQTLQGIDSDRDGVRDDVERYIGISYTHSAAARRALSQYARALQHTMFDGTDPVALALEQTSAVRCIAHILSSEDSWSRRSAELRSRMLNTNARLERYLTTRSALPPNAVPPARESSFGEACEN